MTIDEMIESLSEAKRELGGDYKVRMHICCNGNCDFLDFDNLTYSKIFGLRCDCEAPWWAYKNSDK